MSTFDELQMRFGVGKKLRAALKKRFGRDVAEFSFSVRWWPRRAAPTSAFAGAYRARGPDDLRAARIAESSMPRVEAWFVVGPDRLVEEKHDKLLAHAVEVMSPVPHDAALSLVDAFEFFQLGNALRVKPSTLATDLAEVWHAPKVVRGRLVFFAFREMRFLRISIDLDAAGVEETLL